MVVELGWWRRCHCRADWDVLCRTWAALPEIQMPPGPEGCISWSADQLPVAQAWRLLDLRTGMSVLDLAVGAGGGCEQLAAAGGHQPRGRSGGAGHPEVGANMCPARCGLGSRQPPVTRRGQR